MDRKCIHAPFPAVWAFVLCVGSAAASAQNAARELPSDYTPGVTFSVSIAVNPPVGTVVVGVEEMPPLSWAVSSIDHSGTFDAQTKKIKWGPFFGGSIPSLLTYEVQPSGGASGAQCFSGTASFGGLNQAIGGELCTSRAVPALSNVGAAGLALSLLAAGIIILSRTKRAANPGR